MQFRVPKLHLLALLYALLASTGRAASIQFEDLTARGNSDDDDTDSDSDDDDGKHQHTSTSRDGGKGSTSTSSSGPSSTGIGNSMGSTGSDNGSTTKHGVHGAAIGGIVLASLLALLLLILICRWYVRRRRSELRAQEAAALAAAAAAPPMKETSTTPLLVQQHPPPGLPPPSMATTTPTHTLPAALFLADSTGRQESREMRNVAPSRDSHDGMPLPNPYDGDTPPYPPPRDDAFSSPTSPTSASSLSRYTSYQGSTSHTSNRRSSTAPSAWTHDESAEALLSRGATQSSRLTASSSLTDELSGYQKALEAHHRKEEEDAIARESRIGGGSGVPADPPPVYSPSHDS